MSMPKRGEIWLADLGLAAKTRPVLVLSVPFSDSDYALITVIPRTTNMRPSAFQIEISTSGLRPGAFNIQGLRQFRRLSSFAGWEHCSLPK